MKWRRTLRPAISPPPIAHLPPVYSPPAALRSLSEIKQEYTQPLQSLQTRRQSATTNNDEHATPATLVQHDQLPTPAASTSPELRGDHGLMFHSALGLEHRMLLIIPTNKTMLMPLVDRAPLDHASLLSPSPSTAASMAQVPQVTQLSSLAQNQDNVSSSPEPQLPIPEPQDPDVDMDAESSGHPQHIELSEQDSFLIRFKETISNISFTLDTGSNLPDGADYDKLMEEQNQGFHRVTRLLVNSTDLEDNTTTLD